ncbi:asparagine synthetase B family protein [Aurantiacibacter aquimixticola]|nr:asparagine synthase-related protein [Aurantiacibacter aquimixticola]
MSYRARDGSDHLIAGSLAMGHCASHTSPEDSACRQPLRSTADSTVITMDGYLANRCDLCRQLRRSGVGLRNDSPAEVSLAAYRLWGDGFAPYLEGEFALILFDAPRQRLLCVGDHAGLRQLYYWYDGKTFIAATDIVAVLSALRERPSPDLSYLAQHVANGWYDHEGTAWKGIKRLQPASLLRLQGGVISVETYWQPPAEVGVRYESDREYFEHYRSVFTESVLAASRSSAPLACDVSGGLDSSAIFCLADHLCAEGRLGAPDLLGFTLGAPESSDADERRYVEAVERQTGRMIERAAMFEPKLDWYIAQGHADKRLPSLPNTVMLRATARAAAARGCRVNLTGQGGDQWLDGLPHNFREDLRARDWSALKRGAAADLSARGKRRFIAKALRQSLAASIPHSVRRILLDRRDRRTAERHGEDTRMLSSALAAAIAAKRHTYFTRTSTSDPDRRHIHRKLRYPFALLAYDMMELQAAQEGIEYRHPMLSRKFIEFSARTPEFIRLRGEQNKFIHRRAMAGLLPDEIVEREDKAGFDQTFHPHLPDIEQYCVDALGNPQFARLVDGATMIDDFDRMRMGRIDEIPIWTLWGYFACAAFLDLE